MRADEHDSGGEVEVPLGTPLEVRLPPAGGRWRPDGASTVVQVEGVEAGEDGATARVVAQGQGSELLRFRAESGEVFELTVTVTEPLFED